MPEYKNKEQQKKASNFRATEFTRRQVLKSVAGLATVAAIVSMPIGCKSTGGSKASATNTATPTTEPPSGTIGMNSYIPPTAKPPEIIITGTSCAVATDRLYSEDHIWVKDLRDSRVVVGITLTMFHILYNPWRCTLSAVGTALSVNGNFGVIEGYKLTADLISPVSGIVVQINPLVVGIVDTGDGALVDLGDPYNRGWMMVVQLTKPAELNNLLTPQQYASFVQE